MRQNILGDWSLRFPDFKPREVLSPDIMKHARHMINLPALDMLQEFRSWLGKGLIINTPAHQFRGQRSWREQERVNPGVWSCHVVGCAFDCTPSDMSLKEFREKALEFGWTGIGYYPTKNFVHIDCRPLMPEQKTAVIWGNNIR